MSKILIIAEHDGKHLSPAISRCVSCAKLIPAAEITVAVFGSDPVGLAKEAAVRKNGQSGVECGAIGPVFRVIQAREESGGLRGVGRRIK